MADAGLRVKALRIEHLMQARKEHCADAVLTDLNHYTRDSKITSSTIAVPVLIKIHHCLID
jgi:hypothetical protein